LDKRWRKKSGGRGGGKEKSWRQKLGKTITTQKYSPLREGSSQKKKTLKKGGRVVYSVRKRQGNSKTQFSLRSARRKNNGEKRQRRQSSGKGGTRPKEPSKKRVRHGAATRLEGVLIEIPQIKGVKGVKKKGSNEKAAGNY